MFGLGIPEIIVILLAIGVLLFGGKKIVELARSMGRASGEFKKGKQDIERELREEEQKAGAAVASESSSPATPTAAPATEVEKSQS